MSTLEPFPRDLRALDCRLTSRSRKFSEPSEVRISLDNSIPGLLCQEVVPPQIKKPATEEEYFIFEQ